MPCLLMLLFFLTLLMPASAELTVRVDFEGGSVDVLEVDRETQRVRYYPGRQRRDILVPYTIRITKPLAIVREDS